MVEFIFLYLFLTSFTLLWLSSETRIEYYSFNSIKEIIILLKNWKEINDSSRKIFLYCTIFLSVDASMHLYYLTDKSIPFMYFIIVSSFAIFFLQFFSMDEFTNIHE